MKKIFKFAAFAALAVTLSSCLKEEAMKPGTFVIADQDLTLGAFTEAMEYKFIPVQSNIAPSEWRFFVGSVNDPEDASGADYSWCSAAPSLTGAKGIMISVLANEEPGTREAGVKVRAGAATYTFKVTQAGYGPHIIVSDIFVSESGGTARMEILANIPYTVGEPQIKDFEEGDDTDWITKASPTKAMEDNVISYTILPNYTAGIRVATIDIKSAEHPEADAVVTITQNYIAEEASENIIGGSEKVPVRGARAEKGDEKKYYSWDAPTNPNFVGAGDASAMIDGLADTYYCSPRGLDKEGDRGTEFPFDLIFEFQDVHAIDYVKIYPLDGYGNQVASCNVYYRKAGESAWTSVNDPSTPFTCALSENASTVMFPESVIDPAEVRIEVLETYWNLVKVTEVEFYKTNRQDTQEWIEKVFTDLSCSELKSGVTKADINKMAEVAPYLAKNVAMPMYQNRYSEEDKEFRTRYYEAYSNPVTCKQNFNIRLYTELDSPTGILVQSGESVVVCVDKIPAGHSVRFAVNGDTVNGEEFNYGVSQFSQALTAGVNVIPVSLSGGISEGMAFVIHTDANLTPASEPVRVHILPGSGNVAGYFDISRHENDRLKEMLASYTYKYFFMKGEKIIVAAHTKELRNAVNRIDGAYKSGLAQMDKIVGWEKDLMGLSSHTEFNNHILAATTTASGIHMDASDRRIRFGAEAIANYATEALVCASPWGLGHEIGHVNQPAICWESTIESSNNLFSNYVCMNCGVTESRGRSITTLANSRGLAWYKLGDSGQYQNEDAELHMRMNWQLWNYFHRCKVDEGFWPRLFDIARSKPAPGMYYGMYGYTREDPAVCQMMFYEQACEAAKMDLTEFFDAWGFFVPVDDTYGQYVSGISYLLTPSMIADAKARVAAKNYPKAPAIQYLEDRKSLQAGEQRGDVTYGKDIKMGYYELFRDKVSMTKVPSYSISGRNVTVKDFEQAVAVEIYSASGELQYFSNLDKFTVPERTKQDTGDVIDLSKAVFKAVQWDGVRKEMTKN